VDELTRDQFIKHLRDALKHLHDLERLRHSPLASIFGVAGRFDTSIALQEILTEAITALEPTAGDPSRAHALQVHECLYYLYVQRFSQQEVADQLGMSARQLRRELPGAIEKLAYRLSEQYDLEIVLGEGGKLERVNLESAGDSSDAYSDLGWLKDIPQARHADLCQILSEVLDLAHPLADKYGVRLQVTTTQELPAVAVHPIALNQILLGLLSIAIHRASGGQVCLSAKPVQWEVEIRVQGNAPIGFNDPTWDKEKANIEMACQLAEYCGSKLVLEKTRAFCAALFVPAPKQMQVLVIEDNTDTQQLFQRYALGTRYRLTSVQEPEQALELAARLCPRIIVLDVMMPEVDGWKVLSRLRQNPATSHIPVVICTILPHEELALSLGAKAFVRKPVSRQSFLAALDNQVTQAH
jgi:CheY-like chemotaxis protein